MEDLKKEFHKTYQYYLKKYISVYDSSGTIYAMSENGKNFDPIYKEFADKLVFKANKYLDENDPKDKQDIENLIKELTIQFARSMVNPFD